MNFLYVLVIFLSFTAPAYGQIFTYDNESEIAGAAIMSIQIKKSMVDKTMNYCSKEGKIGALAEKSSKSWMSRNSKYLPLTAVLLEEIHQAAIREKK